MTLPHLDDGDVRLYLGDCVEVMREMDAESVDAVVCDPPYGLEFMGKEWDAPWKAGSDVHARARDMRSDEMHDENERRFIAAAVNKYEAGQPFAAWCETWAREAYRVLKPGGHLLAFGGTRTFHRLACGIEDAGFEVRDCLSWLYGSGFPKSLDVSKAIDKAAGAERAVVGSAPWSNSADHFVPGGDHTKRVTLNITAPEGWGTALKPAWEPCVVARKPLTGTVAANVQAHGTGALNIDGCRIAHDGNIANANGGGQGAGYEAHSGKPGRKYGDGLGGVVAEPHVAGRWPANVAFDEDAAAILDAQTGERPSGARRAGDYGGIGAGPLYGEGGMTALREIEANTGGASRFFYTAKASRADRTTGGVANNTHPTVKPTDLMRWLVRLVTPPGGVVLDPFAGSGSTLVAARAEGFRAIGIEREEEYARIIADRLSQLSLFSEAS